MIEEDLRELALAQYRLAIRHCVDCKYYHATRGFMRLTGLMKGAAPDRPVLEPLFATLPQAPRVLLAGSGDTGQLALVANCLAGKNPRITLVDRCETPLQLCQSFAQQHGIVLRTYKRDIAEIADLGSFDAILAHNFVSFFPKPYRPSVVAALSNALDTNGTLYIVQRVQLDSSRQHEKAKRVPESVAAMADMYGADVFTDAMRSAVTSALGRHFDGQHNRLFFDRDLSDLVSVIREAGLDVDRKELYERPEMQEAETNHGSRSRRYLLMARKTSLS